MNFGITIEKLLLIGVIAALLVGPERLPRYAESLARLTRRVREYVRDAKTRVQDEMGDDVDWRTLDPRQYDPRRIIREALLDDAPVAKATSSPAVAVRAEEPARAKFTPGAPPPFDSEAT
jgi:sec-independent protein translocase protein TatB